MNKFYSYNNFYEEIIIYDYNYLSQFYLLPLLLNNFNVSKFKKKYQKQFNINTEGC